MKVYTQKQHCFYQSRKPFWNALAAMIVIAAMASSQTFCLSQTVEILDLPTTGSAGQITGRVEGFDPTTHEIAAFVYADGRGWSAEPSTRMRKTPINPDGTFTVDVGVDGEAEFGSAFVTSVVPIGAFSPGLSNAPTLLLGDNSLAHDVIRRYGREIEFAGRTWGVKESGGTVGPGANFFSSREEDIFVDNDGALHLTIKNSNGAWRATEAILNESLGYGTYVFKTNSEVDKLDPDVVFGAFTWDPFGDDSDIPGWPFREIDFEDSRWGNADDPMTSQTVVQPPSAVRTERFTLPDLSNDARLTRFFTWTPGRVEWVTLLGDHDPQNFPKSAVINRRVLTDEGTIATAIPDAGRETFRFNLWLLAGTPRNGQDVEVVVTDFDFIPIPEPSALALLGIGLALLSTSRRKSRHCQHDQAVTN